LNKKPVHAHIPDFPYADSLLNAWLEDIREERVGRHKHLLLDYQEFFLHAPPELLEDRGRPAERVRGHYIPRRLRFTGVTRLLRRGLYERIGQIPPDHGARSLRGLLTWRLPEGSDIIYVLVSGSPVPAGLQFFARGFEIEERPTVTDPVEEEYIRDWSPAPPLPPGMVPAPKKIHERYAGDPVVFSLAGTVFRRRLFIGGLDHQSATRPHVHAVLNLGEEPSVWEIRSTAHPADRWSQRGEGSAGMSIEDLSAEVAWVVERLRSGLRVLVHCAAGMNRSATVCCGVLMQLEGLSAEAALKRVRQHHPWARPDSHHWLMLRWLAAQKT
jgi:hypothetical protein